ncbi:MAG: hypothetical protein KF813_10620 [Trueperaceae bacterium]|nr:hypothetical protein [Trueperaceae bacterium]
MMKRATAVLAGVVAMLLGLLGCTTRERLFVGDVGGRRLEVQSAEKRHPMGNQYWTILRWGDLPPVEIRHETTSAGPPYSLSIYGTAPVAAADTAESHYRSTYVPFERSLPVPVMLYFDPSKFSRAQFDQYAAFFNEHWQQVADRITLDQGSRTVEIVGLVLGRDADFVRRFERVGGNAQGKLVVWTNGDIHWEREMSISSTNLSRNVQMPGFQVMLRTGIDMPGSDLTLDGLRNYRDAAGNAFTDLFDVVEAP